MEIVKKHPARLVLYFCGSIPGGRNPTWWSLFNCSQRENYSADNIIKLLQIGPNNTKQLLFVQFKNWLSVKH